MQSTVTNNLPTHSIEQLANPPLPPSLSEFQTRVYKHMPCSFDYLPQRDRSYVKDAHDIISRNEWWGPFREALLSRGVNSETGFMFNNDPLYTRIMNAVGDTEIGCRHSGSSIGYVMREMEFIALHGEPAYRERKLQRQRVPSRHDVDECV